MTKENLLTKSDNFFNVYRIESEWETQIYVILYV